MMKSRIKQMDNGHYSMPLPLKQPFATQSPPKKFDHDEKFRAEYTSFMEQITAKGFAETVEEHENPSGEHNV